MINLGARWQVRKLTVDLTEQIYGPSAEWESDGGENRANVPQYFQTTIVTAALSTLSIGYRLTHRLTVRIGTRNRFNRDPTRYNGTLLAHYDTFKCGDALGVFQCPMCSPFGINGRYCSVRATLGV